MNKLAVFWDVDQTLLDSDARFNAAVKAGNGVFNVDYYRANQTDENLSFDFPLPLLSHALTRISEQYILTARDMLQADFNQFAQYGLTDARKIYHRGNAPDYIAAIQNNGEYKKAYLLYLRLVDFNYIESDNKGNWGIIYDDDKGVLNMANSIGLYSHDAVKLNNLLKAA